MSVKIILIFACTAVGTAVGYIVMLTYKKNYAYLSGMCVIVDELMRNISYRCDSAASVIKGVDVNSAQLGKNVREYLDYAVGKLDAPQISKGFLSQPIYDKVREFFCSLGKSDGGTQISQLKMYAAEFGRLKSEAENKYTKYGSIAVKLGFLFGLGVGVLTL